MTRHSTDLNRRRMAMSGTPAYHCLCFSCRRHSPVSRSWRWLLSHNWELSGHESSPLELSATRRGWNWASREESWKDLMNKQMMALILRWFGARNCTRCFQSSFNDSWAEKWYELWNFIAYSRVNVHGKSPGIWPKARDVAKMPTGARQDRRAEGVARSTECRSPTRQNSAFNWLFQIGWWWDGLFWGEKGAFPWLHIFDIITIHWLGNKGYAQIGIIIASKCYWLIIYQIYDTSFEQTSYDPVSLVVDCFPPNLTVMFWVK
jgi:hypothetical protein